MENIVEVNNLVNKFGDKVIHDGLNFSVKKGDVCAIVGASGSGKTTLFRSILQLLQPTSGDISVFGVSTETATSKELFDIRKRWGVLFQQGALYSSLTVAENIYFPLKEFVNLNKSQLEEIAYLRLNQVGLEADAAHKYPAELSGGMIKRAALARAIALEPELLFLDEPTAGLDPNSADKLEELVLSLQDTLGLTILIVTHDLDTLWNVTSTVAFLGNGKVLANLPIAQLVEDENPLIRGYFAGKRSQTHYQKGKN